MSKTWLGSLLALPGLAAVLAAGAARADGSPTPPSNQAVNVQGVLRNGLGALQSAAFGLDVALYPTASGGSAFFTQHFPTVAVENGYFSIELWGDQPGNSLGFSGMPDAWVEVQVAGDSGPLPRMHLDAVPLALQCNNADRLGGQGAAYFVDTATDQTIAGTKNFAGKVGIGTDQPAAALDVRGDIAMNGASLSTTINVRAILTYGNAAAYCPSGSVPIYTSRKYLGKTGAQICAADARKKTTCAAAKLIWIAADNSSGAHPPDDRDCSQPIPFPWPWGQDYEEPDSLAGEWGHGNTWVVCCQ
jgi:hypothetical protein